MADNSKATGTYYEELACQHLKANKCTLIHRNKTYRDSELDIIARDNNTLLFIEVRYRKKHQFGSALESITHTKVARIKKAAQRFLQENKKYQHFSCRFDVITFDGSETADWIKNAFN